MLGRKATPMPLQTMPLPAQGRSGDLPPPPPHRHRHEERTYQRGRWSNLIDQEETEFEIEMAHKSKQSKAKQSKAKQRKAKQRKANQRKANQSKANQSKANQSKPNRTKAKQTKVKQTKANQSKPKQRDVWAGRQAHYSTQALAFRRGRDDGGDDAGPALLLVVGACACTWNFPTGHTTQVARPLPLPLPDPYWPIGHMVQADAAPTSE
jgi:hypothetical protein